MAVKDICDEEFSSHTVGGFGNLCSCKSVLLPGLCCILSGYAKHYT